MTIEAINGLKSGLKVQLRVVCSQSTAGVVEAERGLWERKRGFESNLLSTKSQNLHLRIKNAPRLNFSQLWEKHITKT